MVVYVLHVESSERTHRLMHLTTEIKKNTDLIKPVEPLIP